MTAFLKVIRRLKYLISRRKFKRVTGSTIEYWEQRAKKYGKRSVINLAHSEEEVDEVTHRDREVLFPLLCSQLRGHEECVLDYGCGPGRFTVDLARVIQGYTIGIDPIGELLSLAPKSENVLYLQSRGGGIPLRSNSVDVVWIRSVLCVVTDQAELLKIASEVARVLKQDGLLFLVENTSQRENHDYIHYRSVEYYKALFASINLQQISSYVDINEYLSVMTGKCRQL